jgi:undecaprenyl-diphosphatase
VTGILTRSADTLGIIAAALVVLVVLWTRRRLTHMAVLVTGLAVELSAFLTVNALIGRDRPAVVRLGSTPSTSSFPSGHTAATLVLYGAIALAVSATARTFVWRALAWLAAAVMPVVVGFARVYRGFHHPTDVFFGLVLGLAALLVAVLAVDRWTGGQAPPEEIRR